MDELLEEILKECAACSKEGKVASYIPELAKANPADFGIAILSSDGRFSRAGDYHKCFTIQSIEIGRAHV